MFKPGQEVVCIKKNALYKGDIQLHPNINDIVTIKAICNDGWLIFNEYPTSHEYEHWNFRKLDYEFVENVLSEVIKQVKEEELIYLN